MDAVQLDLFAELEPKKAWLFEGMESGKNDCEVFTENVIELKKGSYKSFSVEMNEKLTTALACVVAALIYGLFIYTAFAYFGEIVMWLQDVIYG